MPKKPTGKAGFTRLTIEGSEFVQIKFPETKEEIEKFIVESFSKELLPGGLRIKSRHQNRENDLDFSIKTNMGSMFLELMEIAPLENLRGSYDSAPSAYKPFDFAEYIYQKAMRKSERYASPRKPKIVLLLYVTSWKFSLSDSVIGLLQYWFCVHPHSFEYVFFYQPVDHEDGIRNLIYPTPAAHWADFDPSILKEDVIQNLLPVDWRGDAPPSPKT